MIRVAGEERVEDGRGLLLLDVGGVGARGGRGQRKRVVQRDLGVGGLIAIEPGQRIGVGLESYRRGHALVVPVEGGRRRDEALLTGRRRAQGYRSGGLLGAGPEQLVGGAAGERISPRGQRQAPVGHRAGGIGIQHGAKSVRPFLPPEGVKHRHGPLEPPLCLGRARNREDHSAQALTVGVGMLLSCQGGRRSSHDEQEPQRGARIHRGSP